MSFNVKLSDKFIKISGVVAFFLSLAVNGLANTTILGGNNTAEVSDSYPNFFAPAGVTFGIWGIIYTLLLLFCIRLFITPKDKQSLPNDKLVEVSRYFAVVSLINFIWIFAWQYRIMWLSVLLIIGMLYSLIKISKILYLQKMSNLDWLSIKLPFSIYFGWITVATIANITIFLVSVNWSGWGISEILWTIIILIVGAVIGLITAFKRKDWVYLSVFVWAYFGIWLKHKSVDGWNNSYPSIINTLLILMLIFLGGVLYISYKYPKGLERK